jgi:hypothetical protein
MIRSCINSQRYAYYAGIQDKGRPTAFQAEDRGVQLSIPAPTLVGVANRDSKQ